MPVRKRDSGSGLPECKRQAGLPGHMDSCLRGADQAWVMN
jgi:hypothetical protein